MLSIDVLYAFCVASRIWTNMAYEGARDLIPSPAALARDTFKCASKGSTHNACKTPWPGELNGGSWIPWFHNKNAISSNPHIPQSQPNIDPKTTKLSVHTIRNLPRITHSGKFAQ